MRVDNSNEFLLRSVEGCRAVKEDGTRTIFSEGDVMNALELPERGKDITSVVIPWNVENAIELKGDLLEGYATFCALMNEERAIVRGLMAGYQPSLMPLGSSTIGIISQRRETTALVHIIKTDPDLRDLLLTVYRKALEDTWQKMR